MLYFGLDATRSGIDEAVSPSAVAADAHLAAAAQHAAAAARHRECAIEHTLGKKQGARDCALVAKGDSERAYDLSERAYRHSL